MACSASLAMSTSTGPGRPVAAMWKASAMARGDLGRVGDQVVVLGDRHGDAADVSLLEGIGADRSAAHLAGDRNDGHRVHVGVRQRCHQVRRARAGRRHAHADSAGRHRVSLGGVAGTLLVAHQDVPDLGGIHQRVVCRKDCPAGDAEDHIHIGVLQGLDQALRPRDLLAHLRPHRDVCVRRVSPSGPAAAPGVGLRPGRSSSRRSDGSHRAGATKNPPASSATEGERGAGKRRASELRGGFHARSSVSGIEGRPVKRACTTQHQARAASRARMAP